ncbi:MAG TPA: hypothetical protein GXZ51_01320 [Acholeplasma sp.]|jgi:uncharacterized membrane protein YvbJ|nr:hypothetical protein [Acholeplasma sp.]
MNCKKCESQVNPNDYYCGVCGEKIEREEQNLEQKEPAKQSNAAVTLGIIGLVLGSIVLGILAIVFSKKPNASNAKTAKILGIIAIVRGAISVVNVILVFVWVIEDARFTTEIINNLLAF